MRTNCRHFPDGDGLCLVCLVDFDWKPIESIPHTFAARVGDFWLGLYEQPSDKSHWITIRGPAGSTYPTEPKKFPSRSSAESWAIDTLRLIYLAPKPETTMQSDPKKPGETDPKPPGDDELKQPGPDFVDSDVGSDGPKDDEWGEDDFEVDDDDDE